MANKTKQRILLKKLKEENKSKFLGSFGIGEKFYKEQQDKVNENKKRRFIKYGKA